MKDVTCLTYEACLRIPEKNTTQPNSEFCFSAPGYVMSVMTTVPVRWPLHTSDGKWNISSSCGFVFSPSWQSRGPKRVRAPSVRPLSFLLHLPVSEPARPANPPCSGWAGSSHLVLFICPQSKTLSEKGLVYEPAAGRCRSTSKKKIFWSTW